MKTITDIKTEVWNNIIETLIERDWKVTYKYDGIDAGIDYGAVTLEKGNQKIECTWDNWFEGEIQATEAILEKLREEFKVL